MNKKRIIKWIPAFLIMAGIFSFSSVPSSNIPSFGFWDMLVKKGAHMAGYALLALSFWFAMGFTKNRWWHAILLAVLYACSDELHQAFVPGRHATWVDAIIFDGGGASFMILLIKFAKGLKMKRV